MIWFKKQNIKKKDKHLQNGQKGSCNGIKVNVLNWRIKRLREFYSNNIKVREILMHAFY